MPKKLPLILIFLGFLLLPPELLSVQRSDRSQPRIMTLSGKVVMEDGNPPETPMQVELSCNARVIQVTQTRSEGSFHFRLGEQRRSTELSASTSGPDSLETGNRGLGGISAGGVLRPSGDGRYDLTNCEIRLPRRPDWHSDKIVLGVQSVFDTDVGVIVLRRGVGASGTTVSLTSLEAPANAAKSFEQAQRELNKKKPNYGKAVKRLELAVEQYPQFAEAWNLLGEAHIGLSDPEAARSAFESSIQADPDYILPYITLAAMELEKFRWKEALEYTGKLIQLDPSSWQSHYYHGLAHYSLRQYDAAVTSFQLIEQAAAGEQFPAMFLMLGDILARQGKVEASAQRLRRFLEIGQHTPEMGEQLRRQLKEWEEKGLIDPPSQQPPSR